MDDVVVDRVTLIWSASQAELVELEVRIAQKLWKSFEMNSFVSVSKKVSNGFVSNDGES